MTDLSALAERIDICPGDEKPCHVGRGTDDAHFRCGTVQCPHQATLRARAQGGTDNG